MWILFAFGSALFAGLTSILAKCGIKNTDSNVATAIRTIIVLIFSWIMVFIVGAQHGICNVSAKSWTFLILSGLATGASWLCYFRALQIGDVDKVVPVDKSSAILSILLAFIFLHESISPLKLLCVVLIGVGTYLMITKKGTSSENSGKKGWSWFFYALGSAVFASLTSILGLATGASWLCYYRALQDGLASVVVPIDKLSILVTILFSYLVFHEKLGKKEARGLVLIVAGTLGMLV